MFENVNYDFYSDVLGRATVPDVETFEKFKLQNELYISSLVADGLVEGRTETSIDSAVCMAIEVDYKASLLESKENYDVVSESINGYSYTKDTKEKDKFIEQNTKSIAEQKFKWLDLFCYIKGRW